MSRRWPTTPARALLALALAAATLLPLGASGAGADESPGGPPAPTLTVTPSTGLVDHQLVTVEGTGFPADRRIDLQECPARPSDTTCEPWLGQARTDAEGHFSAQVGVSVFADAFDRDDVDCRNESGGRCTIRTFTGAPARAQLRFDPQAPEAPAAEATVTPGDAAVDGQLVNLSVTGLRPGTAVSLYECGIANPSLDGPGCESFPLDDVDGRYLAGTDGRYDARVRVRALLDLGSSGRADCRGNPCSILVADDSHAFGVAPFSLAAGSALAPRVTAEVAPMSGLTGRQTVQVSGANFFADGHFGWAVIECTLPLPGVFPDVFGPGFACDDRTYTYGTVAEDGTFAGEVTVRAVIRHGSRQVADCRQRSCGLVVIRDNHGHRSDQAVIPLTFTAPAG